MAGFGKFLRRGARKIEDLYHASPSHFDDFNHDYMGTGEGSQMHGWGTYSAENPAVFDAYSNQFRNSKARELSRLGREAGIPYMERLFSAPAGEARVYRDLNTPMAEMARDVAVGRRDYAETLEELAGRVKDFSVIPRHAKDHFNEYLRLARETPGYDPAIGLYTLNYNVDPNKVANASNVLSVWGDTKKTFQNKADKEAYGVLKGILDIPPEKAREIYVAGDQKIINLQDEYDELAKLWTRGEIDEDVFRRENNRISREIGRIEDQMGVAERYFRGDQMPIDAQYTSIGQMITDADDLFPPREVSRQLQEAGIPGTKHLDQGSRGVEGDGSYNYVAFNDKDLEITKRQRGAADLKTLLALVGGGGAATAAMTPNTGGTSLEEIAQRYGGPVEQRIEPPVNPTAAKIAETIEDIPLINFMFGGLQNWFERGGYGENRLRDHVGAAADLL